MRKKKDQIGGCLPSKAYCLRWLQGGHYEDERERCGALRPVSNILEGVAHGRYVGVSDLLLVFVWPWP